MPCYLPSFGEKNFCACAMIWTLCAVVGCWKVLTLLIPVFREFQCRWFWRRYPWSELGRWAVVTGGTDGIGKAYVDELAARGFSICIISRNEEKLRNVAREIEEKFGVQAATVIADFCEPGPKVYDEISASLQQLRGGIGVLVNNVGMSYPFPERFHELPGGQQFLDNMISSNVTACTMMLHAVLPGMLARRKGLVVNISSLIGLYPMPMLAVYAACKAYVDYLSRALHYEYSDKGIVVQSLLPGYVATKMSHRRPSVEVPSPEDFVASALRTVAHEPYSYGYLPHKIRGFIHETLKANMPARVNLAISMYFMQKARNGYFRKLARRIAKTLELEQAKGSSDQ